jgi:hypothetical protein
VTGASTGTGRALGALIALTLAAAAACANPGAAARYCTREDVNSASRTPSGSSTAPDSGPAAIAIAAEASRWLPPPPRGAATAPIDEVRLASSTFAVPAARGSLIDRLRVTPRLRVLRLWDSSKLTVFFGMDRRGLPGLRVERQDPRDDVYAPTLAALAGRR